MCDALTKIIHAILKSSPDTLPATSRLIMSERENINGHLHIESSGMVNPVLQRGISVGIAFHSAALHAVERKVVENAFMRKIITVVCSTSTLSAGINLPADRVIIRDPHIGRDFLTCTRYLQMVGRAGRTSISAGDADAFVLVSPADVGKFQQLVEKHVESVRSQLLHDESFFRKNEYPNEVEENCFSGVTRIIIGMVDIAKVMLLSDLFKAFCMTLLYKSGVDVPGAEDEDPCCETNTVGTKRTVEPLLLELKRLFQLNYIQIVVHGALDLNKTFQPENEIETANVEFRDRPRWNSAGNVLSCTMRYATDDEKEDVIKSLDLAVSRQRLAQPISIPDISLCPTSFASAAASAYLSLNDAREFLVEAGKMEPQICLTNPLALLFVSLTSDMSKPIATSQGSMDSMLITKELVSNFENHSDVEVIKVLGITKQNLELWLRGNKKIREDKMFCDRLKKLWTALYAKELFSMPGKFEELCQRFGFDRGGAIEITSTLASRCANLKNFCVAIKKLWWYPPLATAIITKLNDACEEKLRPFLSLAHVTRCRAKILHKMGCRSVKDVACIYPPSVLCEQIKYLGTVAAVEMIMDARRHLSREVVNFAAEADYRIDSLRNTASVL